MHIALQHCIEPRRLSAGFTLYTHSLFTLRTLVILHELHSRRHEGLDEVNGGVLFPWWTTLSSKVGHW